MHAYIVIRRSLLVRDVSQYAIWLLICTCPTDNCKIMVYLSQSLVSDSLG